MNFLDKIRSWLPAFAQKRSIAGGESWVISPTLAGVIVNEDTAVTFAAVYAAINILASDVACYPFAVMKRGEDGSRSIDFSQPNHDLVSVEPNEELGPIGLYGAMMWHLLTKGNAYLEIERQPLTLRPVALHLLDPDFVRIKRTSDRSLYYEVNEDRFLPRDVIHVAAIGRDGLIGRSPITQCREEIGLGMSAVKFGASRFGNGISDCGAITIPETLDEVETKEFRKNINREHQGPFNANKFLLLQGGATFAKTGVSSEDAQFLQTRKFSAEEVCRIFRLPPTKLMIFDKASFSNIEETNLDYYLSSLLPWIRRIEAEFNRKLFTRAERRIWTIEHDESYSLRGRLVDQANVEKIYRDMGVLNTDEIRGRHGWGKVAGGQCRFVPLNMAPLEAVANASLAELKGVKPEPVKPEAESEMKPLPEDTTDEVDVPILVADDDTVSAVRECVLDVARRMVRRETKAIRNVARKANHGDQVIALATFYGRDRETLAEAFGPSLGAYRAATRKPLDVGSFVDRLFTRSSEEILACVEASETSQALNALADRWDESKADLILDSLAIGAASS